MHDGAEPLNVILPDVEVTLEEPVTYRASLALEARLTPQPLVARVELPVTDNAWVALLLSTYTHADPGMLVIPAIAWAAIVAV